MLKMNIISNKIKKGLKEFHFVAAIWHYMNKNLSYYQ